jgi:hypothetical protein
MKADQALPPALRPQTGVLHRMILNSPATTILSGCPCALDHRHIAARQQARLQALVEHARRLRGSTPSYRASRTPPSRSLTSKPRTSGSLLSVVFTQEPLTMVPVTARCSTTPAAI